MFDHLGFYTGGALTDARDFYAAMLAPLGIVLQEDHIAPDGAGRVVFAPRTAQGGFFVIAKGRAPWWRSEQQAGLSPIHLAFRAPSRVAVDQFHAIGLQHGAQGNGAPGDRGRGYYAAYLIDADHNGIEAGFRA